ncbi:MAG TPA: response regulator transcription factor [Rubrobacteraceae bacterium]|nr:response regulator transcription factor [Rubrobacteraceae bacterium]
MNRILLVENHPALRRALAWMLEREREFVVVGEAGTLAEARKILHGVDAAVIDLDLPDGDGVELIQELREANPGIQEVSSCKTLVLTASSDRMEPARAVEAGAGGVLHKSSPIVEVVDALRRLCAGEALLSTAEVIELLGFAVSQRELARTARLAQESLTPREREVLWALAEGLDNKEIAERLGIAVETERNYMTSLLAKLGVHSRLQALVFAVRHGLVDIHSASPGEH